MTAVAVWDHRPSARELLDARVAAGWTPTPTAVRGGEEILGYARDLACAKPAPSGELRFPPGGEGK